MIAYKNIAESVNIIHVAEYYGVAVNGHDKSICPFHSEKTASLSYKYNKFMCFGCGAHGDAIDFLSKLYNISTKASAEKINSDFNLGYDLSKPNTLSDVSQYLMKKRKTEAFRKYELKLFIALCDELHRIRDVINQQKHEQSKEFADALGKLSILNHYIDQLIVLAEDQKIEWLSNNREGVESVAGRFFKQSCTSVS